MNNYHNRLRQFAQLRIIPFIGTLIVVWSFVACQRHTEPRVSRKDGRWPKAISTAVSTRCYGWPFVSRVRSARHPWSTCPTGMAINTSLLFVVSAGTFLFLEKIRRRNSYSITMRHIFVIFTAIPMVCIAALPTISFETTLCHLGLVRTRTLAGEEAFNFLLGHLALMLLVVNLASKKLHGIMGASEFDNTEIKGVGSPERSIRIP